MNHVQDMLKTHPRKPQIDMDALVRCIEECFNCTQTCTSCADACLGEHNVQEVVQCILVNYTTFLAKSLPSMISPLGSSGIFTDLQGEAL